MITFVLVAVGLLVVVGVIYLVLSSGAAGGRHKQSAASGVNAQVQEAARTEKVRASGGDD